MSTIEIDFSADNPITSNALSLAARTNDVKTVRRLLKKLNPNCVDNRGWTCLHEAAKSDSYDSLILILKHPDCRPLAETHEGHTALYLACRYKSSLNTIEALLKHVEDIANYGSLEGVTPLHIASEQGRVELLQLLIDYGAILDVQDFDGDTPLHDAAVHSKYETALALLHAGANPNVKNEPHCYTPFHLACSNGCFLTVEAFFPFVDDINETSASGDTALMASLHSYNDNIVHFLLKNGADPDIKNSDGDTALDIALDINYSSVFKALLTVTDVTRLNTKLVFRACKPQWFNFDVLEHLLESKLGPDFFDYYEVCTAIYDMRITDVPLNSYLDIGDYVYEICPEKFKEFLYLFLMRGVSVNAQNMSEHPPLTHAICVARKCFGELFEILVEHGCFVDYCSDEECYKKERCIPDAFTTCLNSYPGAALNMFPYSLHCDPGYFLQYAHKKRLIGVIPQTVQRKALLMIDSNCELPNAEYFSCYAPPLKHLCRLKIRELLRTMLQNKSGGAKSLKDYLNALDELPIPKMMKTYIRFL